MEKELQPQMDYTLSGCVNSSRLLLLSHTGFIKKITPGFAKLNTTTLLFTIVFHCLHQHLTKVGDKLEKGNWKIKAFSSRFTKLFSVCFLIKVFDLLGLQQYKLHLTKDWP